MSSLIDSYDEWLKQLQNEYDFAKICIKTINDFINKKEDDISKIFNYLIIIFFIKFWP